MEAKNERNSETMYKPLQESPLERNRSATDVWFIMVWALIFSTWMFATVYVLVTTDPIGTVNDFFHKGGYTSSDLKSLIDTYFQACPVMIIITGIALAVLFLIGFLTLLRHQPMFCCRFGALFLVALLAGFIYYSYCNIVHPINEFWKAMTAWGLFVLYTLSALYTIIALICIARSGVAPIVDAVGKVPRIIIRFPYLIVFGVLIYTLASFVILMSVGSALLAGSESFLHYIVLIEGAYLTIFIHYYGLAIISQIVATWHWTEDKSEIPNTLAFQCIRSVTMFHFGSIAFAATIIGPIVASIVALISTLRNSTQSKGFVNIMLMLYLTIDVTKYSLITSSVYGKDFYKSTQRVFRLFTKRSITSFSFLWVFYGIEVGVFFSMMILAVLPPIIWSTSTMVTQELFISTGVTLFLLLLPLKLAENTIGTANYLCTVEDDDEVDEQKVEPATAAVPMTEAA